MTGTQEVREKLERAHRRLEYVIENDYLPAAGLALSDISEALALLDSEQGERTLYVARCGWCGAYEGTVDGLCEDSLDGGDSQIGLHQFGVFELLHPTTKEPKP